MQVIASELRCTAVRITGGEPERLSVAGELAAAAGLEVWFSPFPCELTTAQLAPLFADCADRAEHLRRAGARVVLVTGCELTLFAAGFLPGDDVYQRIAGLQSPGPELYASFGAMPARLNGFLAETAAAARERFGGPLTYASGMWEPVDWQPFDIAATDAYRDATNAERFRAELSKQGGPASRWSLPSSAAAATRARVTAAVPAGRLSSRTPTRRGWTATTHATKPSRSGTCRNCTRSSVRKEWTWRSGSRSRATAWCTAPGSPRQDLDLASYGVVKMLEAGPPAGYRGLGWEPKAAFEALAGLDNDQADS